MASPPNVRLVRCPKCRNVLPEQLGYSVYQCGGCGALLRSQTKYVGSDTFSDIQTTDEEDHIGAAPPHRSPDASGVRGMNSRRPSDSEIQPTTDSLSYDDYRGVGGRRGTTRSGPQHGDDRVPVSVMSRLNHNAEPIRSRMENEVYGSQFHSQSPDPAGYSQSLINESEWLAENNRLDVKSGRNALGVETGKVRSHVTTSVRSGQMSGRQIPERGWMDGSQRRNFGSDVRGRTLPISPVYPDEGSSMYRPTPSSHSSEMQLREPYGFRRSADDIPQCFDNDRAALLRKIDDLKDQLSRSGHRVDNSRGDVPFSRRMIRPPDRYPGPGVYFEDGPSPSSRGSRHHVDPYEQAHRLPYHRNEFIQPSYPSTRSTNHVPRLGDPFDPDMQYQPHHRDYITNPNRFVEPIYLDSPDSYSQKQILHHPTCSCLQCYNTSPKVPAPLKEPFRSGPKNHLAYDHKDQGPIPPYNSPKPQSHVRLSGDFNSRPDGSVRRLPHRVVPNPKHLCPPFAGAAPFLTCHNCFELLHFPKKLLLKENHQKIRCGTCSSTTVCALRNKKLVLTFLDEADHLHDDSSPRVLRTRDSHNREGSNFSSGDFDNTDFDFHSVDRQPLPASAGNTSRSVRPASPSVSGTQNGNGCSITATTIPPLREFLNHSAQNHAVGEVSSGNLSSHEKANAISQNESSGEESVATEMEVPFNEYSNARVSQDSWDMSRDDYEAGISEAGLANLMSKSFRDLSRSSQSDEDDEAINVSINGHAIPYSLIERAEKFAGPICSGDYWYDYRAGFWGAMGGPCLGIILSFIEEFNYPMAKDCAGGTTGILVNGREVHEKDLEVLSMRGLPTDRDRCYIIEFSGRVFDEETGEELESVGKLAPTVEKINRGFGMKLPEQ